MKSETDNAFEVQADLIRVYDAYQKGTLQQRIPTAPVDLLGLYRATKRQEAKDNYVKMMTAVEYAEGLARPLIYPPISDTEFADLLVRSKQWEADMLNRLVMGMPSGDIRMNFDIRKPIRDHLPAKILAALSFLEGHNIAMLYAGVPDQKRQDALSILLRQEFPDVVLYRDQQVAILSQRRADRRSRIELLHPMQCKSLHTPNRYMIEFGFTPDQLEQAGSTLFAGEQ